jgi:histone H3/H4
MSVTHQLNKCRKGTRQNKKSRKINRVFQPAIRKICQRRNFRISRSACTALANFVEKITLPKITNGLLSINKGRKTPRHVDQLIYMVGDDINVNARVMNKIYTICSQHAFNKKEKEKTRIEKKKRERKN